MLYCLCKSRKKGLNITTLYSYKDLFINLCDKIQKFIVEVIQRIISHNKVLATLVKIEAGSCIRFEK